MKTRVIQASSKAGVTIEGLPLAIENLIKSNWSEYEEEFMQSPNKYFVGLSHAALQVPQLRQQLRHLGQRRQE